MSPRQIADDPGRQQRSVWLGPKGVRWPMDWTFEEWAVAFVLLLAGTFLFVFVVPAGVVVGLAAYGAARVVSRRAYPDDPRLAFRLFCGAVAGLCLMISANPMTWVRPLWFPVAVLAGIVLPWRLIPRIAGWVNFNRPIRYWIRIPRLVAAGPRERAEQEISPAALGMGIDLEKASHDRDYTIVRIISPAKTGKSPAIRKRTPLIRRERGGYYWYRGTCYHIDWRNF